MDDTKDIDLATISEYQADMCLTFDNDIDLQTIFKDVVVNPAQDVRIFGKHGVSYEDLQVMKEEYICFEITETPGKIFEKLFQVNRLYNVLKGEMIGEDSKIAAIGLLTNGNREDFEVVSGCLSRFFSLASDHHELTSFVDPGSIPFVLIYTPYRNIYGAVQDLKENVDRKFDELKEDVDTRFNELKEDVDTRFNELQSNVTALQSDVTELKSDVSELKSDVSELKSGVSALNVTMGLVLELLNKKLK
ncbi:hypothetical protein GUITHDRAFT_122192 [Guillardia theta CCMP2712]|uniref:Uncharacterized protein n=1 Tax=Guillardia theta (strain CCMP2712) TaxID=905079 RepID=L1I697_GUITC|nr:hypothetical protein GUITHDRAFT_122192 [Guillardia theta CCMP2712]EKX31622.1 hypothetical protein GUITHDRAFT_122192 [Guillardia theta CCMP2712]|eukprot:XP_005818602.1 hypothetical protein GUITHDRAFT_122192 [Guillardia theta CCMP2712]